jgi:hypothetical protein
MVAGYMRKEYYNNTFLEYFTEMIYFGMQAGNSCKS